MRLESSNQIGIQFEKDETGWSRASDQFEKFASAKQHFSTIGCLRLQLLLAMFQFQCNIPNEF